MERENEDAYSSCRPCGCRGEDLGAKQAVVIDGKHVKRGQKPARIGNAGGDVDIADRIGVEPVKHRRGTTDHPPRNGGAGRSATWLRRSAAGAAAWP